MQRRINPADRRPIAGTIISLVTTRTVEALTSQIGKPAANQQRGKLNYQGKPTKPAKAPPRGKQRVEHKTLSRGQYFGNGANLTAFVWLDDETVPKGKAANEEG